MTFPRLLLALAAMFALISAIPHAEAKVRHHAAHHRIVKHPTRHLARCSRQHPCAVFEGSPVVDRTPYGAAIEREDGSNSQYWQNERAGYFGPVEQTAADLVTIAREYLGRGKFTPFAGPWCRDALNVWLRRAGYFTNGARLALDAVHLGSRLNGPQPGAIGVMARRGGGHVIVVTKVTDGRVEGIGGNSAHHRVSVESYPARRFVAFIWPRRA